MLKNFDAIRRTKHIFLGVPPRPPFSLRSCWLHTNEQQRRHQVYPVDVSDSLISSRRSVELHNFFAIVLKLVYIS